MNLFNIFKHAKAVYAKPPVIKHKVLIAEDDQDLRDFYRELLQGEGFEIITAVDGEEALVFSLQTMPEVILLDVMMPKKNGLQVLEELKNSDQMKHIPVVILTNAGNIENMESAKYHKAFRFLIKSNIIPQEVIKTTKDALASTSA